MLQRPWFRGLLVLVVLAVVGTSAWWTTRPAPATPILYPPRDAAYHLVFDDGFDGSALDKSRWQTQMSWGSNTTGELQHYSPDALNVSDGTLKITASATSADGRQYTSGVISSFDRYDFTYGYCEMRARVPAGQGLWPAFWMLTSDEGQRREIDTLEMLGQMPYRAYMTYHYRDENGQRQKAHSWYDGADFSKGFHTYGALWEPGRIVWYVDGVERYRTETKYVSDYPMYIIANLSVGGAWAGQPDDTTGFPATYEIDYIRVYQRADAGR